MNPAPAGRPDSETCILCGALTTLVHRGLHDRRHGCPGKFDVRRCTACGFGRTNPAPARGDLAELYRRYYPRSSLTPELVRGNFLRKRARSAWGAWRTGAGTECALYVRPGDRVLDIGCGDCTSLLLARALGAREVVGIEVDANIARVAEALGLDVHIGQLENLPRARGTFDSILARQVLEHEPAPVAIMREMRSRLAAGGRIVLSFPNVDSAYRRGYGDRWLHWHVPFHVNHFSRRSVALLARASGLKVDKLWTVTPDDWSRYQRRFARLRIAEGERDPFWDPPAPTSASPASLPGPARKTGWRLSARLGEIADSTVNRAIDALGLGDSWVAILTIDGARP